MLSGVLYYTLDYKSRHLGAAADEESSQDPGGKHPEGTGTNYPRPSDFSFTLKFLLEWWGHPYHSACVEVRGQLAGVSCLIPLGGNQTKVVLLGSQVSTH